MELIPSWAPNVHPMLVHFPIVLVMLGAGTDFVRLVRPGTPQLERTGTVLYALAAIFAVSAYVSGRFAAAGVFIPGMAHGLVDDHEGWALAVTACLVLVSALRLGRRLIRLRDTPGSRLVLAILGLVVAVLVQQTAERGARLVFEQGVGVIPGTSFADPGVPDSTAGGGTSR